LTTGLGVVIGETAVVEDDVLMYQGVVLGGTSLKKKKLGKRLQRLEGLSGLAVPEDEFRDKRREIVRKFGQGGEI